MKLSRSPLSRNTAIGLAVAGQLSLALIAGSSTIQAPKTRAKLQYNRDVRPILAENCFPCHGPDSAARKGDLRLDRIEDASALKGNHAAIVKGKPAESELVHRINGQGPLMPPPAIKKVLTAQQKEILARWIAEGAQYEKHWSFLPPRRPALPKVKNVAWVRNPIDRFVLARLEKEGLTPAPEADKRTLARRLSLDLTGLPPEPALVEEYLKDKSPDAYEKLVDKLMAMPQWGEHRGRYWLDAARYGDTHGIHIDNFREIWAYRDWVISAFNKNMPFDQFTIEQIAGDLLPNPTLDQRIATGFNRCNITTSEGGAIDEEYKVLYAKDRTETTAAVFLGATMNCTSCHDHKYDPYTQKDYYSLSAFFNNTTQRAMDGNVKDTPPVLPVPRAEDRDRYEALKGEVDSAKTAVDGRKQAARPDFDKWLAGGGPSSLANRVPASNLLFHAPLAEGSGTNLAAKAKGADASFKVMGTVAWVPGQVGEKALVRNAGANIEIADAGDREKDQPFTVATWVKMPRGDTGGSIVGRMDEGNAYRGWDLWLEGGRVGTHIINKFPDDALKVVAKEPLKAGQWQHVVLSYDGGAKPESIKIYVDGVQKDFDVQTNSLKSTVRTTVPLKIGQRNASSQIDGLAIQDLRFYGKAFTVAEASDLRTGSRFGYLAMRGVANLSAPEKDELYATWLSGVDEPYKAAAAKLAFLEDERRTILGKGTIAHVMQEMGQEPGAFILFRGEYDQRRDAVKPATPAVLPAMPADAPKNRLGLAKWLMASDNPLTARVTVNRFWQELFGTGLVKTAGDFGVAGELPSHPELLDWLAIEFRDGGWDMKKFYKLLVTSAAYRQSATVSPEKLNRDPDNRLLARGPRFRMDAEMVRDYALASSGLLVKKLGGPSVRPYQPDGVWEAVAMPGSDTRDYRRDKGENLYRRSMYTFWKRSAPPAEMEIFNAPSRETCTVRRERTNTPIQALATMNDVQFIEAARTLAQKAIKEGGATPDARVNFIAQRVLARPLGPAELVVVKRSYSELQKFYDGHDKEAKALVAEGESKADATVPPAQLAAWTMLTNQLLNLDEVLNK